MSYITDTGYDALSAIDMVPDDLGAAGRALYGPRWQSQLARDLQVSDRTVRRWLAGRTSIPASAEADVQSLLAARHSAIGGMTRMMPTSKTARDGALYSQEASLPFAGSMPIGGAGGGIYGFMRGSVVIPPAVDLTAPVIDKQLDSESGDLSE